jgi:nucleotide-binding universal stress UspA family protein
MEAENTVVVVFDGSDASYEDLGRATEIAEGTGATLEVALATNINRWSLALGLTGGYDTLTLEDEVLDELERELAVAIAGTPRRIEVRRQVVRGSTSRFLRRRSAQSRSVLIASTRAA